MWGLCSHWAQRTKTKLLLKSVWCIWHYQSCTCHSPRATCMWVNMKLETWEKKFRDIVEHNSISSTGRWEGFFSAYPKFFCVVPIKEGAFCYCVHNHLLLLYINSFRKRSNYPFNICIQCIMKYDEVSQEKFCTAISLNLLKCKQLRKSWVDSIINQLVSILCTVNEFST